MSTVATPSISSIAFRQVMAHVPTAVSVVAATSPTGPVGLTLGSFTSVSLEPPLVGFFPAHASTSWPRVRAIGRFAVSVLGDHAEETCRRFARSGGDKFDGLGWHHSPLGSPVLDDAVAWFDCELESEHEAGDHTCVLARLHNFGTQGRGRPLIFCHGTYQGLDAPGGASHNVSQERASL